MTSIINDILIKNGKTPIRNTNSAEVATYNPNDRANYVTLANACELATEIIFGVMKTGDGIGRKVGDVPLLKRDVAEMVASRMLTELSEINNSRGA